MAAFGDLHKFCRELSLFPDAGQPVQPPPPPVYDFSVLSYNINMNFVADSPQVARIVEAIHTAQADIVCLQETHSRWQTVLTAQLDYPHSLFLASGGAGGAAFLSRHPFVPNSYQVLHPEESIPGSWFPVSIVDIQVTPALVVTVANCHLRPPVPAAGAPGLASARLTNETRRQELEAILTAVRAIQPEGAWILAGDMNENDGAPGQLFLKQQGLVDALEEHVPPAQETHRWPWGPFVIKKRLDHVFYTPLRLTCQGCRVLLGYAEGASDHQPVLAYF
jgi:endonuclease/exonuclease/phosphatase family metal-dependent hydrolase